MSPKAISPSQASVHVRRPLKSYPNTIGTYVRFAGLRRSGNHAVINWIVAQYPGQVCFRNNVENYGALTCTGSDILPALRDLATRPVDLLDSCDKSLHLVSFEDKPLEDVFRGAPRSRYRIITRHQVRERFHVVILRDPFNYLASRLQRWGQTGGFRIDCNTQEPDVLTKWREYAECYLKFAAGTFPWQIAISYNSWLTCKEYRERLCGKLGISLSNDEARLQVSEIGGGSSFVGMAVQDEASYLNRWRLHRHHPMMERLLNDCKLLDLSDRIFQGSIRASDVLAG